MLVDTGGYVISSADLMEQAVSEQSRYAVDEADVILFVVDVKIGITEMDSNIAKVLLSISSVCCQAVFNHFTSKSHLPSSLNPTRDLSHERTSSNKKLTFSSVINSVPIEIFIIVEPLPHSFRASLVSFKILWSKLSFIKVAFLREKISGIKKYSMTVPRNVRIVLCLILP